MEREMNLQLRSFPDVFGAIPWISVYEAKATYRPQCQGRRWKRGRTAACSLKAKYLYMFADGSTTTLCAHHLHSHGLHVNLTDSRREGPYEGEGGEWDRLMRWRRRTEVKP